MLLIFAEILLLALAPTQQESSGSGSQNVQTLLQQFYEQYYTPTQTESFEEVTARMARTEPVFLATKFNKQTAITNTIRDSSTAPRMLGSAPRTVSTGDFLRTQVVGGRAVTRMTIPTPTKESLFTESSGSSSSIQNQPTSDTFFFAPNSGSTSIGTPRPKANNEIQERCDQPKVLFQSKCYSLLTQGPCASDESIVELNGRVQCSRTKCRYPQVLVNGQCHDYKQFHNCPAGMSLNVNRDGTGECDCLPGYLYHGTNGRCFEAYRQGPCRNSHYLALVPDRNMRLADGSPVLRPSCVNNPCRKDGMVCYGSQCSSLNPQRNCVALNSVCDNGLVVVDWGKLEVTCSDPNSFIDPRVIGNVPSFACSPGSKRDISGNCRKTTTMTFS